ncbi:MAG: sulfatase [Rhodothermales bacterium]
MQRTLQNLICTLLFTLLVVAVPATALGQSAGSKRPNVVLILSDDHRFDFMSFHEGAPNFLQTPNMDRLAAGGMHVKNAFVTTSLCSPSRASILTGRYAHNHGVVDNARLVPEGTRFFPAELQRAGYQTAFIGKWHMGGVTDEPRPGFDHWVSFRGQGTYFNPTLNVDGSRKEYEGYNADILTDFATKWIREQSSDQPFFLYLSHKSVHAEFQPAPRHQGRYEDETLVYPKTMANTESNYRDKPRWVKEQRYGWHGVDYLYQGAMNFDTFYRRYTETLLALDESIGQVIDELERDGLMENTIVIYMSDNGFSFGEHGLIDKRHGYEESIRVPMIAYAPGRIEAGSVLDEMILNIDMAPTILDLAGVKETDLPMDGRSFSPLLFGQPMDDWRREFAYEYYWEYSFPHTPTVLALRGERYKYLFYHGIWDLNEFYDLSNDPLEEHNLINSAEHADLIKQMKERLFDILDAQNATDIAFRRPTDWQANERLLRD